MDILYKMDPMKIMNLRVDSLSQILNVTNVHRNIAITLMWALGVPRLAFLVDLSMNIKCKAYDTFRKEE